MPIKKLDIFCYFNKQRFTQFGSMDAANFYGISSPDTKMGQALYPTMGRRHVEFLGSTQLVFNAEPRMLFKSINYMYVVVSTRIYQVDKFFNTRLLVNENNQAISVPPGEPIWSAYLPVGKNVYVGFTDGVHVYILNEETFVTRIATTNAPETPRYIAVLGNRFVVSVNDSPTYYLSQVNLGATPDDPATWFTIPDGMSGFALFNNASGVIRQMVTLHNQLYILLDFSADIWSNIPTQISVSGVIREFPFKLNSSYNWDYGIADPFSIDVDFGMMAWLAQNRNGLVTFMVSNGQQPQPISTQAVNVLLERDTANQTLSPFLEFTTSGFLYQWENTVFYRASAGSFFNLGQLDIEDQANSIEYCFDTKTWHRLIELNGQRNRIQRHVFFNNRHFVTVEEQTAVYEMGGDLYFNELQDESDQNLFKKYPMRYELTTAQIFEPDYSEFITDYIEIDFVFGDRTFFRSLAPFNNTQFIVSEDSTPEVPVYVVTEESEAGNETFMITEGSNTPEFDDNHYWALMKPHIELYWSDDGGVTFQSADLREFSPLGAYRWRMRWYSLGASRNRCYRLICVSSAPIVILGAVQQVRRASGGAN